MEGLHVGIVLKFACTPAVSLGNLSLLVTPIFYTCVRLTICRQLSEFIETKSLSKCRGLSEKFPFN
jgi:hypothetical protein